MVGLHLTQISVITVKGITMRYFPSLLRSSIKKRSNINSVTSKLTSPLKKSHGSLNPEHPPGRKISERKSKLSVPGAKLKAPIREATDQGHQGGGSRIEEICSRDWRRGFITYSEAERGVSLLTHKTPDDNLITITKEGRKAITIQFALMIPGDIIVIGCRPGRMDSHKEMTGVTGAGDQDRGSGGPKLTMTTWRSHGCAQILIRSLTASATLKCQGELVCLLRSRCTTEARIRRITSRSSNLQLKLNAGPCQYGVICLTPHSLGPPEYGSMTFLQRP